MEVSVAPLLFGTASAFGMASAAGLNTSLPLLVGDKVPALDSVVHAVQWPLAMAAGAILFASQQSIVRRAAARP